METNTPLDTVVVANTGRKLLTGDPCLRTCLCKTNAASSTRAGCGLTDFPMSAVWRCWRGAFGRCWVVSVEPSRAVSLARDSRGIPRFLYHVRTPCADPL